MNVYVLMLGIITISGLSLVNYDIVSAQLPTPVLDARDDNAQTNEDNAVTIDVMNNDVYILLNPSIVSVSQPSHGQAIKIGNNIKYTPNENYFGPDVFRYRVSNGVLSDTASVYVTVNPVNDNPVAVNDNVATNEDNSIIIDALVNDSDIEGDSLTINSVTQGSHGTSSIIAGNRILYAPNANFHGQDTFSYTINDGNGGSASATISVTVNPINDPPVAVDDSAVTDEDTSTIIDVLQNDSDVDNDQLTIVSITQPNSGTASVTTTGIQYGPNPDFNGNDSFTYTISDGNGGQDTASVSVTINAVSDFAISKTQSGLVGFDPLNNETQTRQQLEAEQGFWHYGGSAFTYFNPPAPTDLFKNSEGLHVGVNPPINGTYAGYYAVTGPVDAQLFHAVITTPVRTISGDFFQNGLYVQTWDGRINYVTCVSITSTAGTSWHIVRTFGNNDQATQFEVLWSDLTPNQPLTRDCTIITNGNNYLKIYLDSVEVYESNNIDLQMPGPFLYFLEPQNSHAQMLYGVYEDFYMTKDETIKITNLPEIASRVDVTDSAGNVLVSGAISNGTATMDVGMYHFPLVATIKVYDINSMEIVSTSTDVYGGDQYAVTQQ